MSEPNLRVMRAATILWIGVGLLLTLDVFAVTMRSASLVALALALTAVFALAGIGFGIWAGRRLDHIQHASVTPRRLR